MAFNWEKLQKAQREFPKPKFALDAIGRHLKKRPSDPYVLAWKASTLLVADSDSKDVLDILTPLCQRQPPITDVDLLSFIYKLILEASRFNDRQSLLQSLFLHSAGNTCLMAWQNAAKAAPNQRERLELWSALFVNAMAEDCWEDVRFAIVQANKESPKFRRVIYYTLILANQLSAEKKIKSNKDSGKIDPGSRIQLTLALRQMKEAFDNSPKPTDETIQMRDMRDLRFMASLYQRQHRCPELFKLWDQPPSALKTIMDKYTTDIILLKIDVARKQKEWRLVEALCLQTIEAVFTKAEKDNNSEPLHQICQNSWSVFSGFLDATMHLYPKSEATEHIDGVLLRFEKLLPVLKGRAIDLTHIALTSHAEKPLLPLLREYWLQNFSIRSCYTDIRQMVPKLPVEEQGKFYDFIVATAKGLQPEDSNEEAVKSWLSAEASVLMFHYPLIVSRRKHPSREMVEDYVLSCLKLHWLAREVDSETVVDSAYLAIMGLVQLAYKITNEAYYLLQATMLAQHCLQDDRFKDARPFALMSTRLHLYFGFGTTAFQHYRYAKVKEMLHDTLSWMLLTRISQTHPFDVKGVAGFSADAELSTVITTMRRMETRTDDLLYNGMKNFEYDTALELLDLKRKLKSSMTKHICTIERRRIARLKGESFDQSLDLPIKDYYDISDNRDMNVLPNPDYPRENRAMAEQVFQKPINVTWLNWHMYWQEIPSRLVYKERLPRHFARLTAELFIKDIDDMPTSEKDDFLHQSEISMVGLWQFAHDLAIIVYKAQCPGLNPTQSLDMNIDGLLIAFEKALPKMRKAQKEPGDFPLRENCLMDLYAMLEPLRVLHRIYEEMLVITKQKAHPLHKKVKRARIEAMKRCISEAYAYVRWKALSAIEAGTSRGKTILVSETRQGRTGGVLAEIIPAADMKRYANEYVESNLQAIHGVLKVKLE